MISTILTRKIYFLTGKRYPDLNLEIEKMSERGKASFLRLLNDLEYEKLRIKKSVRFY